MNSIQIKRGWIASLKVLRFALRKIFGVVCHQNECVFLYTKCMTDWGMQTGSSVEAICLESILTLQVAIYTEPSPK